MPEDAHVEPSLDTQLRPSDEILLLGSMLPLAAVSLSKTSSLFGHRAPDE